MIDFVIVEDNELQRKCISEMVTKFMMKNKLEFVIHEFKDLNEELKEYIPNVDGNQIYILDFELISATAIDVARYIRKYDWRSPIIVLTAHGGMAFETFKQRLQILDFISKQYEAEKNLFELFEICLKQLNILKSFKFKIRGVDYNIPYERILYIYRETAERKVVVVTNNNKYKITKNMSEMFNYLDDRFKYTHKACIVNTDRVEAFVWKEGKIIFDNKTEIYLLSKTHKKELENKNVVV